MAGRVVIVGVGNPERGDDGVGPAVLRELRARPMPDQLSLVHCDDPLEVMELFSETEMAAVVDAIAGVPVAGTVLRFDVSTSALPVELSIGSTHAIGVAQVIELARALGLVPPRLVVYGIVGSAFAIGETLSAGVERAIRTVADAVLAEACMWLSLDAPILRSQ